MKKILITLAILLIGIAVMAEAVHGEEELNTTTGSYTYSITPAEAITIQSSNVEVTIHTKDIPLLTDQELTNLGLLIAVFSHVYLDGEVGKQLIKRLAPERYLKTLKKANP